MTALIRRWWSSAFLVVAFAALAIAPVLGQSMGTGMQNPVGWVTPTGGTKSQSLNNYTRRIAYVTEWGDANTCNGTQDDLAAFTAARDAVGIGGIIKTPEGTTGAPRTCIVSEQLVMTNASSTLYVSRNSIMQLQANGSCATKAVVTINNANITITGAGIIDGNRTNCATSRGIRNLNSNGDNFTVSGAEGQYLTIQNTGSQGIYLLNVDKVTLKKLFIYHTGSMGIAADRDENMQMTGYNYDDIIIDRSTEVDTVQGGAINLRNADNEVFDPTYGYRNPTMSNITAIGPVGQLTGSQGVGAHGVFGGKFSNMYSYGWQNSFSFHCEGGCSISNLVGAEYHKKAFEIGGHGITASALLGIPGTHLLDQAGGCLFMGDDSHDVVIDGLTCGLGNIAAVVTTPTKGATQLYNINITDADLKCAADKACINMAGTYHFNISGTFDGTLGDADSEGVRLRGKSPDSQFIGYIDDGVGPGYDATPGDILTVTDVTGPSGRYDPPYVGETLSCPGGVGSCSGIPGGVTVLEELDIDDSGLGTYRISTPLAIASGIMTTTAFFAPSNYGTISGQFRNLGTGVVIEDNTIPGVIDNLDMRVSNYAVTTPFATEFTAGSTLSTKITLNGAGLTNGNATNTNYNDLGSSVMFAVGSGSPEGSVTAGKSSIYQRKDGAAGSMTYVHEAAIANTGWVALPSINAAQIWAGVQTFTTPILGAASATSLSLTGTGGAGFVDYQTQSSAPATPGGSGFRIFADSTGKFSWKRNDGFVRTLSADTLSADRVYTFPNADISVAGLASPAFTGTVTAAAMTLSGVLTYGGVALSASVTGTGSMVLAAGPTLSGVPKIATLSGGTAASSTLTLESTTAAGTSDSMAFKTGSQSTFMGADTNGLITVPKIGSDATHTDSSVCQDTTTHALYSGSGTLGICLGTSMRSAKERIHDLPILGPQGAIARILASNPQAWFYKRSSGHDPNHQQYGFMADDMEKVFPELVGHDTHGKANSFDMLGMFAWVVKFEQVIWERLNGTDARVATLEAKVKTLKAANDNLEVRLRKLEARR